MGATVGRGDGGLKPENCWVGICAVGGSGTGTGCIVCMIGSVGFEGAGGSGCGGGAAGAGADEAANGDG